MALISRVSMPHLPRRTESRSWKKVAWSYDETLISHAQAD